jgi:DNA invertase Pin-like site-specific DNA recombinase
METLVMESALIIARCSTNDTRQDVTRQSADLMAKYGKIYRIVSRKEYYKSGTNNDSELADILEFAKANKIQHLLFTEISRVSRRMIETLSFIRDCNKEGINLIIDNYNLHTLNADKTENHTTAMMLSISATFAQAELRLTKQRLDSGRAKYIADGGVLGRRSNTKESAKQTLLKHKDIVKWLEGNHSVRNIMEWTGKSTNTIQKVKSLLK